METHQLTDIAITVMEERGFEPGFSQQALAEAQAFSKAAEPLQPFVDMRDKQWVSIDNDDSKDLDQLTYAEQVEDGVIRIFIAVADVDSLVKKDSYIDHHASHNTTSVYTPTAVFPMLPLKLSTDLTSLNEGCDRAAIVVEVDVLEEGTFEPRGIYTASVHNHARLTYKTVAAHLDKGSPLPTERGKAPGISEQLHLQHRAMLKIRQVRQREGNLTFDTGEAISRVTDDGKVILETKKDLCSSWLIENFMIAANITVSRYFRSHGLPILSRVVTKPKRWERIIEIARERGYKLPGEPDAKALQGFLLQQKQLAPDTFAELSLTIIKLIGRGEYIVESGQRDPIGHFDLALREYAHTTAPNRRFPDLIIQRLLKCHLQGMALPYDITELTDLAMHCTQKEDDAAKVERRMHKSAAALVLSTRIGEEFEGIVTGASAKGTWIRLTALPIEGKIVKGFRGLDVGNRVKVRLMEVDIEQGFIDFARK